ncbi:MAG TPA: Wzz/FepE/Etk N-terminal domain-containing protein [Blastocatellia bacterium]|nr:Wzz/FepE/Etk N-terminal domain-containing protein [Blastocatellia bacterium]
MTVHRQLNVEDWLGIFRRRKWQIIIPAALCALAGLLISFAFPKQYTSHTRVLVEAPIVPDDIVKPVVSDDVNRRLASMQGEILSRTHLEGLIEQNHLYAKELDRVPMESLVDRLRKSISVLPMAPTPGTLTENVLGFNIDVTLGQAQLAQQVCTQLASMFKDYNSQQREQQSEDTTQFLANQLSEAKLKLDDQDAKLAQFQNQYLGAQPGDEQTNLTMLAGMTQQLEAVTQGLNEAQANKAFAQSMLTDQLAARKASNGGDPQTLQHQLDTLQAQLVSLRAQYTDKHPEVIQVQEEIADLQKKMQAPAKPNQTQTAAPDIGADSVQIQQLRAELNQAQTAIAEKQKEQTQLQQQIKGIQARIQLTPMVQEQYSAVTRDRQTALDFYNSLLKRRDDAQMATNLERRQESENFKVLDPPSLPEAPSFPNRQLFTLGGFAVGLVLGAALIRVAEMRDKSLRQPRDVEMLLGVPTLAVISSRDIQRIGASPLVTLTGQAAKTHSASL